MASAPHLHGVASNVAPAPARREPIEEYLRSRKQEVDRALDTYLELRRGAPDGVWSAMRHAVLGDGKRLRPALVLAACECCGGDARNALPMACALELIHIASLVHDDLPAMDSDDFRRGVPSLHKVYGEAVAILAGDALIVYAFQIAAESGRCTTDREAIALLARSAGAFGMAGGQLLDLAAREQAPSPDAPGEPFNQVLLLKTVSLIEAAVQLGALCADGSADQVGALGTYGRKIGLAFQVVDDILDRDADTASGNVSYCTVFGTATSETHAGDWIAQAHEALRPFGEQGRVLHELADFILRRKK